MVNRSILLLVGVGLYVLLQNVNLAQLVLEEREEGELDDFKVLSRAFLTFGICSLAKMDTLAFTLAPVQLAVAFGTEDVLFESGIFGVGLVLVFVSGLTKGKDDEEETKDVMDRAAGKPIMGGHVSYVNMQQRQQQQQKQKPRNSLLLDDEEEDELEGPSSESEDEQPAQRVEKKNNIMRHRRAQIQANSGRKVAKNSPRRSLSPRRAMTPVRDTPKRETASSVQTPGSNSLEEAKQRARREQEERLQQKLRSLKHQ